MRKTLIMAAGLAVLTLPSAASAQTTRWDAIVQLGEQWGTSITSALGMLIGDTVVWADDETGASWSTVRQQQQQAREDRENALQLARQAVRALSPDQRGLLQQVVSANPDYDVSSGYNTDQDQSQRATLNPTFTESIGDTIEEDDERLSFSGTRIGAYVVGGYSIQYIPTGETTDHGSFAGVLTRGGGITGRYANDDNGEEGGFSGQTNNVGEAISGGSACDTNCSGD